MDTLHDLPMGLKIFEEDATEDGVSPYTLFISPHYFTATRLKFETVGANALSWLPNFCLMECRRQAIGANQRWNR